MGLLYLKYTELILCLGQVYDLHSCKMSEVNTLTPQNPALPEKLEVTHLVNTFSAFYETQGPC